MATCESLFAFIVFIIHSGYFSVEDDDEDFEDAHPGEYPVRRPIFVNYFVFYVLVWRICPSRRL